jgi:DNA-binding transcriptional ArsR family regulator
MLGTDVRRDNLAGALFGKAQQAVLSLLLSRPGESFYVREIVRATRVGQGAVQRELKRLAVAGIIERVARGRQVFYQANPRCPIFAELQGLIVKTLGVGDMLRSALEPLQGRILLAFLFGSFAGGQPRKDRDVDVLVVGDVTFAEVVSAFGPAQDRLGRDVNPSVYPAAEVRAKLAAGHHFLTSVWDSPKVLLIGGDLELARLAEKRLADRTQAKSARDTRPVRRGRS